MNKKLTPEQQVYLAAQIYVARTFLENIDKQE